MCERSINQWQRRARIAIWLQFVVILVVVSIARVERAELFRIYSGDGVFVAYDRAWWFALWSGSILATWGVFVFPAATVICAVNIQAPRQRAIALIAAILLALLHLWLCVSTAQHAIL